MKFTKSQLEDKSKLRLPGYYDAVMSNSLKLDDDFFEINDEKLSELIKEHSIKKEFVKKDDFERRCKISGQGYREEFLNIAKDIDSERYEIDFLKFKELEQKYRNPSIFEMIKNAGIAATEAIASGLDVRDEQETKRCLTICSTCQFLIVGQFRCNVCGCFLSYKVKLKDWRCPKGKW